MQIVQRPALYCTSLFSVPSKSLDETSPEVLKSSQRHAGSKVTEVEGLAPSG